MKLAFIDTETTGLDYSQHEVIEFAVQCVKDGRETFRGVWKIRPEHVENAEPIALKVNGYTPEAWGDAQTMSEIGPLILDVLKDHVIVGHNVSFDLDMLKANLERARVVGPKLPHRQIDTVTLAYEHLTPLGLTSVSLDKIRAFLGWTVHKHHDAMTDVTDARRVFDLLWRMGPLRRLILRTKLHLKRPV
jgi:DNA polymerase III subunit epsilon